MPRRSVVIKSTITVVVDDERSGIPSSNAVMAALLLGAAKIPGVTEILGGAKFSIGLTRESMADMRRIMRVKRANSR